MFFCCDFDAPIQLLFGNGWKIWRWMDLSRFCIWYKYFNLYTSIVWIFCPLLSLLCVYYIKSFVAKLFDVSLSLFVCWKSCARKVQARQFVLQDELRSGYFNVQITICFRQSIYQLLLSKSDGFNLIEEGDHHNMELTLNFRTFLSCFCHP